MKKFKFFIYNVLYAVFYLTFGVCVCCADTSPIFALIGVCGLLCAGVLYFIDERNYVEHDN